MIGFNEVEYRNYAKVALNARELIEQKAKELHEIGYSNIVFTGVGGTTAEFESLISLVRDKSDVEIYNLNAAELLCVMHPKIDENTLFITGSKSGDTKETVAIIRQVVEKGNKVFAITGNPDSPVAKEATHVVLSETKGVEFTYQQFYYFIFKLLHLRGDFKEYEKFADQLSKTADTMISIKNQFDDKALEIAKKHYDDDYQIWIGSGESWGDVYLFSMCILEECQWMRTKSVTSPEFFHGTIELTDDNTPIFLIKGIGNYRPLDQRVADFLEKHSNNHVIIDLADFEIENFDEEFKYMLTPMIVETLTTDRLAKHFENLSGHSLDLRRFYRQMEY